MKHTKNARLSDDNTYLSYGQKIYKTHTNTRQPQYRLCTNTNPICHIPADIIILRGNTIRVIGSGTTYIGTNTYEPDSIDQFLKNAPEWQKRIWGTADVNVETLTILIMHLINDNVVAGGDGSVNNGKAAHAWCIATKNDFKPIIEGAGPNYGEPK